MHIIKFIGEDNNCFNPYEDKCKGIFLFEGEIPKEVIKEAYEEIEKYQDDDDNYDWGGCKEVFLDYIEKKGFNIVDFEEDEIGLK